MIQPRPFDPVAAMQIFKSLDPYDRIEAEALRTGAVSHLTLFADWYAAQAGAYLSLVLYTGDTNSAFAVLVLGPTGQAGVGQAALLARSHDLFARPLLQAARRIRRDMPAFCAQNGLHRIEARSHKDHPRAGRFLRGCGFQLEADMPGFGPTGAETFCQYAWVATPSNQGD